MLSMENHLMSAPFVLLARRSKSMTSFFFLFYLVQCIVKQSFDSISLMFIRSPPKLLCNIFLGSISANVKFLCLFR